MIELTMIEDKINIFATLMRGKFESKVDPLLDTNISLEELDRQITPKIELYFKEFEAIGEYYGKLINQLDPELSKEDYDSIVCIEDTPERLTEDDYRVQKCLMLKSVLGNRVLNKIHEIMEKAQSMDEIDQELTKMLEWYYGIFDEICKFYHYGKYDEQDQNDDDDDDDDSRE